MSDTSVPKEATGMQNLDPDRPSPIVEALAKMLAGQHLTVAEGDMMIAAIREARTTVVHQSWCDDHGSDEYGEHCSLSSRSYGTADQRDQWAMWAMTYAEGDVQIILEAPAKASIVPTTSITARNAIAILAALEYDPTAFAVALQDIITTIHGRPLPSPEEWDAALDAQLAAATRGIAQ